MNFLLHSIIFIGLFSTLSMALDLVAGHLRMVSVCHGAFFGLGAYTMAILSVRFGLPILVCLPIAALIATGISVCISIGAGNLRGDFFAIATMAFHVVLLNVFLNWDSVTGGVFGIRGVSNMVVSGIELDSLLDHVIVSLLLTSCACSVVWRLSSGAAGRVLHLVREDKVLAAALGINVKAVRLSVFGVSTALAAMAGVEYAAYMSYVDPTSFPLMDSILIIGMVYLGGAASRLGPVLGAAVLVALPELFRFVGLPPELVAEVRQLLFGISLVAVMLWRPRGLLGARESNL